MRRVTALLIVGGIALFGLTTTGPARAVVPGKNGRILFARGNCVPTTGAGVPTAFVPGCHSQSIVVANSNDTNETVLVTDPSDTIFASWLSNWSPDGRTVILARDTCRTNATEPSGIWTVNADGTGLAQLVQAPDGTCFGNGPVYTPDGTRIVVEFCCVAGYGDSLWIMNSDGSALQPLTSEPDGVADEVPQISPDGTWIAFSRCSDDGCRLAVVPITGGTPQVLLDEVLPGLGSPNWSPDSTKIVFNHDGNGCVSGLATINADGTGLTQLTSARACGHSPSVGYLLASYSPDGKKIIFVRSFDTAGVDIGYSDLFTMNPNGSGMTRVTYTAAPEANPEWAVASS